MLPVKCLLVTSAAVLSSQTAHWPSVETIEADFIPHDPHCSPCRAVRQDIDSLPALQDIVLSLAGAFNLPVEQEKEAGSHHNRKCGHF